MVQGPSNANQKMGYNYLRMSSLYPNYPIGFVGFFGIDRQGLENVLESRPVS
jgi:hypothetical protein